MSNYSPQFTNSEQVKIYLQGKAFNNNKQQLNNLNSSQVDSLNDQILNKFIVDAESEVQLDLSRQFVIPLTNSNNQPFNTCPQQTQLIISRMATWMSCIIILKVYFGKSEGVRGGSYVDYCIEEYQRLKFAVTGINEHGQYIQPPLQNLLLNSHASYRSAAGAPAPLSVGMGVRSRDNAAQSRRKLVDLNKSIYWGYGTFNRGW